MRSIGTLLVFALFAGADMLPSERMNAKLLEYAQDEYKKENWVESYNAFMRIERTSENLPTIHYYLGKCSYEMGAFEQAEDHYKTVLRLKPNHAPASFELARVHLKYARRHEESAKSLFATIPPSELDSESRDIVSDYSGFSKLPHSHKVSGNIGVYGFYSSKAGEIPQLIDSRIAHPDPTPSQNEDRESSHGYLGMFTLDHAYTESSECGFRWENSLQADGIGFSNNDLDDSDTTRFFGATKLAFRVYERFWLAPEYFMEKSSFADSNLKIDRVGWALNVSGALENDSKAWGRLALYNHKLTDDYSHTKATNKALKASVGYKHMVGLNSAQMEISVDHMYDKDKEDDELGLYTQNQFRAFWSQFFTTKAQGELGFDYFMTDYKTELGNRKDKVFAPFLRLDWCLDKQWAIDYMVKLSSIDSNEPNSSYSQNIARVGVRYHF